MSFSWKDLPYRLRNTDPKPWKFMSDIKDTSILRGSCKYLGQMTGGDLKVSVDRAGILFVLGELVGLVLSPLGRKGWRWQLQVLLNPKAANE